MNRTLRFLMGLGTLVILAPAMALVLPEHNDSHSNARGGTAPAMAAVERDLALSAANSTEAPTSEQTASSETTSTSLETSTSDTDKQAEETTTTTAADHSEDHESDDHDSTDAESDKDSTTQPTSPPKSTTTSTSSSQSSGTITGEACPCEVSGTVELKGQVNLQGDLIVSGGTLVARPGVDVNGNGFQIMFMNGGKADFQGSKVFTWSDRGAKQNIERDINFRNMRRIIWMGNGGASTLKYFTVSDSGTSTLGDYPMHWHLNGDSTRGTIVEGVVVINGKNHAYVPHGSNGITFKDVVAKNIRKEAFWWDPPGTNDCSDRDKFCTADNSNDITYDHVLVDGVTIPHGQGGHHTVSGFHLGAGSGNVVRNSAAINIDGGKNCSGFHWPSSANQNAGGNVWAFSNNYSKSADCHGIFVWQNDSNRHVVIGFNGSGIDHGAYGNKYEYRNFNVPYLNIHASGWSALDGKIGTVVAHRHRQEGSPTAEFTNVEIDRFIVDNKQHDGKEPGHYVLNNTGLTCSDIEYKSAESGTTMTIDGDTC